MYDYLVSIKDTTPLSLWIPLTTPITYHLPSISALKTFIGRNNIWTNTNEDTTVAVSEDEVIEQVTPQKLTTVPGTNTIAWTAEVDGKEMSVTYSKEKEP